MSLDDTAEKARRNLVAAATGIIAVWVLGIPLDGKLIGAINLDNVQPWRAWFCATTVLVYFWLRYKLSPKRIEARDNHRNQKEVDRKDVQNNFAVGQFYRFLSGKRYWIRLIDMPTAPVGMIPSPATDVKWTTEYSAGKITFLWYLRPTDGTEPIFSGAPIERVAFRVQWPVRAARGLWHQLRRIRSLTWNSLEVSLPVYLTSVALAICLWKLGGSLYYDWPFVRQLLSA